MNRWETNRSDGRGSPHTARKAEAGEDGGLRGAFLVPGRRLGING